MSAPPPPPPHGGVPKGSGLPPGKYDIFVIPEHSAGSGFLYLPSLQPNVNSFAAGFASALILVALFQSMAPAFRAWWDSFQGMGNTGLILIIAGVGFGAWALGRTQQEGPKSGPPPPQPGAGHGGAENYGPPPQSNPQGGHQSPPHNAPPPNPGAAPPPPPPHTEPKSPPPPPKPEPSKPSWQRPPQPQPGTAKAEAAKGSWEKAREETRKREEERKAKEAEQKRREEAAKRLAELRAREARERQEREAKKEKEAREAQAKKEAERKAAEAKTAELRAAAAAVAAAAEEKRKKEEEAARPRQGSSYAFSGVGEKTSMWPNGRPPVPSHSTPSKAPSKAPSQAPSQTPSSPNKKPPAPTAKTYLSTEEDAYSFRPYDKPRKPRHMPSISSLSDSEASWAPSQTTAKTTPPASFRGPYSTKDPDKIVISGVYLFASQFAKEPASQLLSGVGSVTDGLILRITTEGLFIDDDVRGVPQREWDVKAWTLKQVEVWCPPHCLNPSSSAHTQTKASPNLLHKMAGTSKAARAAAANKALTGEEADAWLAEMLRACKDCCRLGLCERHIRDANITLPGGQTGNWQNKGLHVLRATVRDQDGKRYLFVVEDAESWKLSVGLQRLRRGTQVRQLGVSGMTPTDAKTTLEMLGYE